MISGAIICESLTPGTTLERPGLQVTRLSRYRVPAAADYQAHTWTLIEFTADDTTAETLAEALAEVLAGPGWYANWNSDTEATVVFPGKIFQYPRGDTAGREAAQAHAGLVGVPEPQLDWAD